MPREWTSIRPKGTARRMNSISGLRYLNSSVTDTLDLRARDQVAMGTYNPDLATIDLYHPAPPLFSSDAAQQGKHKATNANSAQYSVPGVILNDGAIANRGHLAYPPPPQTVGFSPSPLLREELRLLSNPERPPVPEWLVESFRSGSPWTSLEDVSCFWLSLFTAILTRSRYVYDIELQLKTLDRQALIFHAIPTEGEFKKVRMLFGLVCRHNDEDAPEIASRGAWPKDWNPVNKPGLQCWYFVATDRLKFYVYSGIDDTYIRESTDPSEGYHPLMDYEMICEKLISRLEQHREWILPYRKGHIHARNINPNAYHFEENSQPERLGNAPGPSNEVLQQSLPYDPIRDHNV